MSLTMKSPRTTSRFGVSPVQDVNEGSEASHTVLESNTSRERSNFIDYRFNGGLLNEERGPDHVPVDPKLWPDLGEIRRP
jgi:hypothetical protein